MPPTITKQDHKPAAATSKSSTRSSPSILSEAIDVADLAEDFVKMVIYGQNRVGKTTLACCFPKPLLLVALEPNKTGGAMSVTKVPGVKYLKLSSSEKAVRLARELKENNPFKTVVLDSATSYQDIILKEILDLPSLPEQLDWGTVSKDQYRERSEKTRESLRPFIDLDCHVVVTAKERDHNPPKDDKAKIIRGLQLESFFAADLGGATVGWLHDACDYIGRLYVAKKTRMVKYVVNKVTKHREEETGKLTHRLLTMYHPNFAAGMRSANSECVPEFVEADKPEEMYRKVMQVIEGTYQIEKEGKL